MKPDPNHQPTNVLTTGMMISEAAYQIVKRAEPVFVLLWQRLQRV